MFTFWHFVTIFYILLSLFLSEQSFWAHLACILWAMLWKLSSIVGDPNATEQHKNFHTSSFSHSLIFLRLFAILL